MRERGRKKYGKIERNVERGREIEKEQSETDDMDNVRERKTH